MCVFVCVCVCVFGVGNGEIVFVGCCKERVGPGHIELERDYTLVLIVQELCESRGGVTQWCRAPSDCSDESLAGLYG